jgi:hypothetical protein
MAVLYALVSDGTRLWLGTGGNGRLYAIDQTAEERSIAYEYKLSAQITGLTQMDGRLYVGLSNPARLVRLEKGFETRGVYQSPLVDAGQPAQWGKIQLEAELPPAGSSISRRPSRSGNVGETPMTRPFRHGATMNRYFPVRPI